MTLGLKLKQNSRAQTASYLILISSTELSTMKRPTIVLKAENWLFTGSPIV